MSTKSPYSKPEYFYNRELSWLLFNRRVLEEAKDSSLPLFDRLKFLSITSSNLDEFFMIRVASLKDMVQVKYNKKDISGMTPAEQLAAINERTHLFVKDQYDIFNRSLIPALEKEGVHVLSHYENLSEKQSKYVDRYFTDEVYPVLTPMAVDSSRPFPLIRNKTLNIGAILRMKKTKLQADNSAIFICHMATKRKELIPMIPILQRFRFLLYCLVLSRSHPSKKVKKPLFC